MLLTAMVSFGLAASLLASMRAVAGNVREWRARQAMTGSFVRVHERQHEFRRVNARFATYAELKATGLRLPGHQQVRRSSADASHWYLSLRDRRTGLVCERTGELMDETGLERPLVCRTLVERPVVASGEGAGNRGLSATFSRAVTVAVAGGLGGQ